MSGFDNFLGNEKLKERLLRDIRSERLTHAYIIEGAAGSGKKTLAKLIAAAVSCSYASVGDQPPCMKCQNCDKIMRDQSPDVTMVEPDKDRVQLGVDVIRRLRGDAVYAANDLDNKFYIFPDADVINPQAQNTLLKILEEPPEGVMFLMLCINAQNLLSTIRSRAPVYRLEILGDELIEQWLVDNNADAKAFFKKDEKAFRIAVKLAGGSLGRAMELCNQSAASECLRLWNAADGFISLLAKRRDASGELDFYEYATKLAAQKQRAELSKIYMLLADAVRDLIAAKLADKFIPLFYISADKARETAAGFPIARLFKLSDVFAEAIENLGKNVNLNLTQSRTALAAVSADTKYH